MICNKTWNSRSCNSLYYFINEANGKQVTERYLFLEEFAHILCSFDRYLHRKLAIFLNILLTHTRTRTNPNKMLEERLSPV